MPEIYVHAVEGRNLDQKRALVKDITEAVVKHFKVKPEAVMVQIMESPKDFESQGRLPLQRPSPGLTAARPGTCKIDCQVAARIYRSAALRRSQRFRLPFLDDRRVGDMSHQHAACVADRSSHVARVRLCDWASRQPNS